MRTSIIIGIAITVALILFGVQYSRSKKQTELSEMEKTYDAKIMAKATFAEGCFCCTESDFEKIDGVVEVISGYTGGDEENPTYEQVSSAMTGHYEAV